MTLLVVVPIFGMIAIGWLARHLGLIDASAIRGLREIVFRLVMPAMLFASITRGPAINFVAVTVAYFAACLVVFAAVVSLARGLRASLSRAAMLGINSAYGNTVMIGIPVVSATLGHEALQPLFAIIALHSALLLPLAGLLIHLDGAAAGPRSRWAVPVAALLSIVRNPVIVTILVAFAWRALDIPLPAPVRGLVELLGSAAIPLALLCLGASLPKFGGPVPGLDLAVGTVAKLAVLPALVWIIGRWMGLPASQLAVAVVTAAMPTGANAFLLTPQDEDLVGASGAIVVVTTGLSFVTVTVLLRFLAGS